MGTEKDIFGKAVHYSMGKDDKPKYDLSEKDDSPSLEYRNFSGDRQNAPGEIVQYVISRRDLSLSKGYDYMAVQQSHASIAPISNELRRHHYSLVDEETKRWIDGKFKKIFLESEDEKSLIDLKLRLERAGIETAPIYEEGLSGKITSIGIKPTKRERVSEYLKDLPLSRNPAKEEILFYQNNEPIRSPNIAYSQIDIENGFANGDSFTLLVSERFLLEKTRRSLKRFNTFLKRDGRGTGNDYVDNLGLLEEGHLRKNDCEFNSYMLQTHYDMLMDPLKKNTSNNETPVVITSLENLIYIPNKFIFTGKALRE
tara:strand:- start:63 stop:1001 length:939 start_codon:yes stop_codon:yes gene_type:complete